MRIEKHTPQIYQYFDICTDEQSDRIAELCHDYRDDNDCLFIEQNDVRNNKSYNVTITSQNHPDADVREKLEEADTLINDIFSKAYNLYTENNYLWDIYHSGISDDRVLGSEYIYRCYDVDEQYKWHVDKSVDKDLVLAFILYLNDDFVGGKTLFLLDKLGVDAKKNSILVFPCGPHFIHRGTKVSSGYKKIIWSCFFNPS
tara:strand:+ start:245 stop:847 length:603 start_codon:yes stop_codon:yes gene_type:complete